MPQARISQSYPRAVGPTLKAGSQSYRDGTLKGRLSGLPTCPESLGRDVLTSAV